MGMYGTAIILTLTSLVCIALAAPTLNVPTMRRSSPGDILYPECDDDYDTCGKDIYKPKNENKTKAEAIQDCKDIYCACTDRGPPTWPKTVCPTKDPTMKPTQAPTDARFHGWCKNENERCNKQCNEAPTEAPTKKYKKCKRKCKKKYKKCKKQC